MGVFPLTPNLMWVCFADNDLQSVGGRVSLRHGLEQKSPAVELGSSCASKEMGMVSGAETGMVHVVSVVEANKTYDELVEIIHGWQELFEEAREDLKKANARIVEIKVEKNNLLEKHVRSLQESVAVAKRHDRDVKALKKEIDELRREQTSNKVGGDYVYSSVPGYCVHLLLLSSGLTKCILVSSIIVIRRHYL